MQQNNYIAMLKHFLEICDWDIEFNSKKSEI